MLRLIICCLAITYLSCAATEQKKPEANSVVSNDSISQSIDTIEVKKVKMPVKKVDLPEDWVDLGDFIPDIIQDIRYATENNFVKAKMYDCGKCLLRKQVAEALLKVHLKLKEQNLGLKVFDCYRPRPFQQRLWDKVPDARYVTPPSKGSMHNRGAAVDLTIVDSKGKELDMGTDFDYFGSKAYHTFKDLPEEVLANRVLLRETMASEGFKHIRTEWWHYSYTKAKFPLSDYLWPCE